MRASSSPTNLSNNQTHHDVSPLARSGNKFAHFIKPSVPAIPKRDQSFGYVQVDGELRRQPQPRNVYSGIGQDTVGPAAYNSHEEIWDDRKNVAPSLRSTVKREVWEENTPRSLVPGPGQYESVAKNRDRPGAKQSAVFASKVPILPDPKPVGRHDPEREMEIIAKEERGRRYAERQTKSKQTIEAFGSTTGRMQLSTQLNAPFSHPSYTVTPGPGMYAGRAPTIPSQRKHKPPVRAHNRDEGMGFSSATERYCLSTAKVPAAPGPGAYRSETPRSMDYGTKSKLAVGRRGVFGTTSERRVWEQLERRVNAQELPPGPGAYDGATETHGGHFPLSISSAAFKSSSERFVKRSNPHAPPHVHCVGEQTAPAVGQYEVSGSALMGGALSPTHGNTDSSTAQQAPVAPFLSKTDRDSVFDKTALKDLPGPGAYVVLEPPEIKAFGGQTRSRGVRTTLGNEERFRVKPTVPENVGPGAYAVTGTVGTKSFNVTMAAKSPSASDAKKAGTLYKLQTNSIPFQ